MSKSGYSAAFFKDIAQELTDNISLSDYQARLKHYKGKLDEDADFEDGANILMNELYNIEQEHAPQVSAKNSSSEEKEFRIINAMINFFPHLKSTNEDDINFKIRTAETLKDICTKSINSSNPYLASLAKGTLEKKTLDMPEPGGSK